MNNISQPTSKTKKVLKILGLATGILAVAASIAQISGYSVKDLFTPKSSRNFSVTVFVHGKNGKHDLVLRQEGYVLMDVNGGERKKELIDDKGAATFKNVIAGEKVNMDVDFSEPYKALHRDSIYIIPDNGKLYLQVALQGIDKVRGTVLFHEKPLESVTVKLIASTGNLFDTTNQTGDFTFTIPDEMQNNKYELWFIKKGFKTKKAPAYPQTGELVNIIMEKE